MCVCVCVCVCVCPVSLCDYFPEVGLFKAATYREMQTIKRYIIYILFVRTSAISYM